MAAVDRAGADWIHVDVMDGRFVPNLTIGPLVVRALRGVTKRPLDVHLMIVEPEKFVPEFAAAGADVITVHVEATAHLHRALEQIRAFSGGGTRAAALSYGVMQELRDTLIEVDGGVGPGTVKAVLDAGADVLVAGSAVFGTKEYAQAISTLRNA